MEKLKNITPKQFLLLLIVLFIVPYLLRHYIKQFFQIASDRQQQLLDEIADNPMKQQQYANQITTDQRLHNIAESLVHHLGTSYSWYNPKSWSENDAEVLSLLLQGIYHLDTISQLYTTVYSRGRSLRADINAYLDNNELQQFNRELQRLNINF